MSLLAHADVATDVAFVFGELIDLFVSQPKLHKDSSAVVDLVSASTYIFLDQQTLI